MMSPHGLSAFPLDSTASPKENHVRSTMEAGALFPESESYDAPGQLHQSLATLWKRENCFATTLDKVFSEHYHSPSTAMPVEGLCEDTRTSLQLIDNKNMYIKFYTERMAGDWSDIIGSSEVLKREFDDLSLKWPMPEDNVLGLTKFLLIAACHEPQPLQSSLLPTYLLDCLGNQKWQATIVMLRAWVCLMHALSILWADGLSHEAAEKMLDYVCRFAGTNAIIHGGDASAKLLFSHALRFAFEHSATIDSRRAWLLMLIMNKVWESSPFEAGSGSQAEISCAVRMAQLSALFQAKCSIDMFQGAQNLSPDDIHALYRHRRRADSSALWQAIVCDSATRSLLSGGKATGDEGLQSVGIFTQFVQGTVHKNYSCLTALDARR